MSDWVGSLGERRRGAEIAGWTIAAALVLAAHAAGGYWLTQAAERPPLPGADEMIIEISLEAAAPPEPEAEPEAIPDIPMQAAPDLPISETEPEDLPEPEDEALPDLVEPDPLAEMLPDTLPLFEPPPEPLPEPELPVIETAEAVLAPEIAKRPPPRPEPKKTTKTPPAPKTSKPAKVDAPKVAETASAPASQAGKSAEKAEANWRSEVNSRVARHMARWPNRSKSQVSLRVSIAVDGSGRVIGAEVQGTTGDPSADASLRAHAAKISGLPRTPDGNSRNLRIPVTLKR